MVGFAFLSRGDSSRFCSLYRHYFGQPRVTSEDRIYEPSGPIQAPTELTEEALAELSTRIKKRIEQQSGGNDSIGNKKSHLNQSVSLKLQEKASKGTRTVNVETEITFSVPVLTGAPVIITMGDGLKVLENRNLRTLADEQSNQLSLKLKVKNQELQFLWKRSNPNLKFQYPKKLSNRHYRVPLRNQSQSWLPTNLLPQAPKNPRGHLH